MTEIILKDIDPVLVDRIRRISEKRGWDPSRTLYELLEHGLHVLEGDGTLRFDSSEADVLQAAIDALQHIPDDSGFSLIGRLPASDAGEGHGHGGAQTG